jgi:DNA (cytosine-5)-methyltransferase 1
VKVLNLYAGIGGNRKLWPKECEVTAVENNKEIAGVYQDFFPEDKVVIADAHQYLLEHYKEFDFIWSSPPCPTHSVTNRFLNPQGLKRYPDMALYQEIIFLTKFCYSKWVVENVKPYYEPLIRGVECERHYFWANFPITPRPHERLISIVNARVSTRRDSDKHLESLEEYHGFDLSTYPNKNKRKMLRNCVRPELGLHVFECAFRKKQLTLKEDD